MPRIDNNRFQKEDYWEKSASFSEEKAEEEAEEFCKWFQKKKSLTLNSSIKKVVKNDEVEF